MLCCETTQPLQDRLILTQSTLPVTPPVPVAMPIAALPVVPADWQWSNALASDEPLLHVQSAPTYILTGSLLI
jgi:hypothetical protein